MQCFLIRLNSWLWCIRIEMLLFFGLWHGGWNVNRVKNGRRHQGALWWPCETGADLWYLPGQPVLHDICLFTRLGHCFVLRDQSATHVCQSLLHLWVKYYGPPVLLYTDLGNEFDNELIRMFAARYGITLHCAPGGSHWSLGGVERHHYQLRHTVELLLEADDTLSLQDACDVACMSLNYHPMPDRGFSPQQLVYGVSSR